MKTETHVEIAIRTIKASTSNGRIKWTLDTTYCTAVALLMATDYPGTCAILTEATGAGRTALYNAAHALTHEGKPWIELRERLAASRYMWREQKHSKFAPVEAPPVAPPPAPAPVAVAAAVLPKDAPLTEAQRQTRAAAAEAIRQREAQVATAEAERAATAAKIIAANESRGLPAERPTVLAVTNGSVAVVPAPLVVPPKAMIADAGAFAKAAVTSKKRTEIETATGDCLVTTITTTRIVKGTQAWCEAMLSIVGRKGV